MRNYSGLTTRVPITGHERLVARAASSMWEGDTGEVFIMGSDPYNSGCNSTLEIMGTLSEFALRSIALTNY